MNRSLVWREWQEMATQCCWAVAALVFLVMTTRIVDEVFGVAIASAFLAIILGNASTASERSPRIREFLLTRPVSRRRVLGAKLAITLAMLNGALALMVLSAKLDLPGLIYGLVSETTLGERIIHADSPVFYPLAIAFANFLLMVVLYARLFLRSPTVGTVGAVVIMFLTFMGTSRLLAYWASERATVAWMLFGIFLIATVLAFGLLRRRFVTFEISGGGV